VGDQQHAHRPIDLQATQQVEDLCLDGDVKCRRRLVGDQQAWIACQRDGDHHPLLHAAGKLEGIFAKPAARVGNADRRQQFERPFPRRLPGKPEVAFEHLAQLVTDGQHRVEAGRRLLKNHRHAAAANATHLGFGQAQQIASLE
jgi:hypothetical protein